MRFSIMARSKSLPAMSTPPLAYTLRLCRIAESHHSNIKRASAKVKDDDVLRFGNGLFVIQCRGDWLQFEVHFFETSFVRGLAQSFFRFMILFSGLGKFNRSSKRYCMNGFSENIFSAAA